MMTAVLEQLKAGRTPVALMGSMDAPKLSSSVQLLGLAWHEVLLRTSAKWRDLCVADLSLKIPSGTS